MKKKLILFDTDLIMLIKTKLQATKFDIFQEPDGSQSAKEHRWNTGETTKPVYRVRVLKKERAIVLVPA